MRTFLRLLTTAILPAAVSGCGSLAVLQFKADENSGVTADQTVHVAYVNPIFVSNVKSEAEACKNLECFDFKKAKIPDEIERLCTEMLKKPMIPALAIPFIVAAGQAAFDVIVGAIDARREKLKKAAVREYGATALANDLSLGSMDRECVIVQRKSAGEPAMVLVSFIDQHVPEGSSVVAGLTMTPVYLRVDKAAAQTGKQRNGRSKINLSQTITIAAVQSDPKTNVNSVKLITTSPFSYSGIEIGTKTKLGTEYVNPKYVPKEFDFSPDTRKELNVAHGPLFVPLRNAPAVGTISVAVVERGSAAALDDVSAIEKAIRASIRGAIGSSVKEALKE